MGGALDEMVRYCGADSDGTEPLTSRRVGGLCQTTPDLETSSISAVGELVKG